MKLFISWSGSISHYVAKELGEWLQYFDDSLEIFISSKEISKGSIWFNEISNHLKDSTLGIVVLTPDNLKSPWINFEAGALFQGLPEPRVIPFLVGIKNFYINDTPLAMFQTVSPERIQIFDLLKQINCLLTHQRTEYHLNRLFEKYWPGLDAVLQEADSQLQANSPNTPLTEYVTFAKTQQELESQSHGIYKVLNDANILRISGGTFKTFCDSSRNMDAVKRIMDQGGLVRLIMLNPKGDAISMLAKMRKDYAPRTTEKKLQIEIEMSIDRMIDAFGMDVIKNIVRLYLALPRYGLCISDKYALLTLYLHGHGASSPSLFLRVNDPQTKDFCDRLINGFDDAWSSSLCQSPERI